MSILNKLRNGLVSTSPETTLSAASQLALSLPPEAVLLLEGDLGAGKTTFVKGLAQAWGIRQTVTSPTFNIYNLYQGERQLAHMDAYRLEDAPHVWEELMLEELLQSPFCLAIEWPSKLSYIPWETTHRLEFKSRDADREIRIID